MGPRGGRGSKRAAEGQRCGAVKSGMAGLAGLGEAEGAEGGMVFDELNPGLQRQSGAVERLGAGRGSLDQRAGQPLAAMFGGGGEFAEILCAS